MLCLLSLYFVKVIILLVFGVEGGGVVAHHLFEGMYPVQ